MIDTQANWINGKPPLLEGKRIELQEKISDYKFQKELIEALKNDGFIEEACDLYGSKDPSILFPFLIEKMGYHLNPSNRDDFTPERLEAKKRFNSIIHKIGPSLLGAKQVMLDKNVLIQNSMERKRQEDAIIQALDSSLLQREHLENNSDLFNIEGVPSLKLPDEPTVIVANHGFKDDILGTIIATGRPCFVMFASLPYFYNTIEGLALNENGVIILNRKIKESKRASVEKGIMALENGFDVVVFAEGVWNKTPNLFSLPLWDGAYRIAASKNAPILPYVHYILDPTYTIPKKENVFYTVQDNYFYTEGLSREEVLDKIKTSFATWSYLMMESFGNSNREELIGDCADSVEAWEEKLEKIVKTAGIYYDKSIETDADFKPHNILTPLEVYKDFPEPIVRQYTKNDFQHRF